ncbi:hypothetical protein SAMN04489717_1648 [Actinopolymorpha singaporensis]|uniref:Uncharacterized protein n=1 Tax=Actinopolymorpha singaporensis TaxID=117157 RepID=A0A1H1PIA2_9ACTN|nr:hypothetical protein SAMN04489717_1648 [Actinopolymorpha singaporensis]
MGTKKTPGAATSCPYKATLDEPQNGLTKRAADIGGGIPMRRFVRRLGLTAALSAVAVAIAAGGAQAATVHTQ